MFGELGLRRKDSSMNEKGDEEQHKAEQLAKAVTSRFGRLSTIEERYLLMLEVAGRQTADQAPLRFYAKKEEGLLFNVIFELSDAGLIKSKAYREHGKTISDVRDCVAVFGITYRGRMELARLEREEKELEARKWRWGVRIFWISLGALISTLIATVLPRLANKALDCLMSPEVHQVEVITFPAEGVAVPGK